MNNFVTYDDFVGDKNLPNLDKDSTSFDTNYVAVYQKEILIKLLGYDLYLAFEAGLALETPLAIWTDLRDGSTYVENGINKQNPGCSDLVAYYVYCNYLSINYEEMTGVGVITSNSSNAVKVAPDNKIISAWNKMYKDYYLVYDFITANVSDYPNWEIEYITKMLYI